MAASALRARASDRRTRSETRDLEITIVSPEEAPLQRPRPARPAKRSPASSQEHGIRFLPMTYPDSYAKGELRIVPGPSLLVDAVVSLPRLKGVPLAGVPQDEESLHSGRPDLPRSRARGRVRGRRHHHVPREAGGHRGATGGRRRHRDRGCRRRGRRSRRASTLCFAGLLLSGSPRFFRAELSGGHGRASTVDTDALWWPAAKIAARYLSPYLAEHAGLAYGPRGPASLL